MTSVFAITHCQTCAFKGLWEGRSALGWPVKGKIFPQNFPVVNVEMSVKKEASLAKCVVIGTQGTHVRVLHLHYSVLSRSVKDSYIFASYARNKVSVIWKDGFEEDKYLGCIISSLDSSCVANSRWIWPLVVVNAFINFLIGNVLEKLRLMSVLFLEDGSAFSIRSTAVTSLSIVACWVIASDVPVNATVAKVDAIFSTALLTVLIFCTTPWATSLIDGRSADRSFDSLIMLSVTIVAACVALSTLVSVSMRISWCCCLIPIKRLTFCLCILMLSASKIFSLQANFPYQTKV